MDAPALSNSFPPLGDTGIRRVERRLGIALPEDLAAFYRAHNGGHLHPDLFVAGEDVFGVQIVLPMLSGNPNIGFEETYEALVRDTPEFPRGMIPFAAEEGGDYFVYSVRAADRGAILFNQSEYVDDPERFLVPLAPTLAAFLDGLTDDAPPP